MLHPAARKKTPVPERPIIYVCGVEFRCAPELFFNLNKYNISIETMAAANFSRDVLEMFYGSISNEENRRMGSPIRPRKRLHFEIVRNDFNQWLRVWKMRVPGGNQDILKFFQKTKDRFIDVCREEVQALRSVKIQFGLLVRFNINRNGEVEHMEHYFNRMQPIVLDKFPIMQRTFTYDNKQRLLLKKGIYPYEYMDSFERFDETQLPEKEEFYSSLSGKGITDEEYEHAQEVWAAFGCRTMGDYLDLYVKTDVLLLADVFENFRQVCQEKYGLDRRTTTARQD